VACGASPRSPVANLLVVWGMRTVPQYGVERRIIYSTLGPVCYIRGTPGRICMGKASERAGVRERVCVCVLVLASYTGKRSSLEARRNGVALPVQRHISMGVWLVEPRRIGIVLWRGGMLARLVCQPEQIPHTPSPEPFRTISHIRAEVVGTSSSSELVPHGITQLTPGLHQTIVSGRQYS